MTETKKKDYDKLKTCKFYTIEDFKNLKKEDFPKMYCAEGIMLTATGYAGLDGYFDDDRELQNTNGWFNEPTEIIGVSVNNLISVFPSNIQKLILDINKLDTGNNHDRNKQFMKIVSLISYIQESYDELSNNHIIIPEIVLSGTSASWSSYKNSAFGVITIRKDHFYSNSEQMGNWHQNDSSSFEDIWRSMNSIIMTLNILK